MKLILALATPIAALALAAPAHADQYDYVSVLDNEGVYYDSISDVIDLGKMTCRILRSGSELPVAARNIASAGYRGYEIGVVVQSAASNMCPDVLPALRAFLNDHSA